MANDIASIVIVGGGTAGWLAASYLQSALNKPGRTTTITLIESSDIGTIGVGEATTLTFPDTLRFLGIDEANWMVRCNATFKLGIKFVDWLVGEDAFWFPFRSSYTEQYPLADYWLKRWRAGHPQPFGEAISSAVALCRAQKAPRQLGEANYEGVVKYGYHLDAGRLASYLCDWSKERGVIHVVDDVVDVMLAADGFIDHLVTAHNGPLRGDLYIDCSGFRGLLINQALAEPFVPFGDTLFCDQAIAVNVPTDASWRRINPYLTATALNAGWVWNIPLFNRLGMGYVYASHFISPEMAEQELARHLRTLPGVTLAPELSFRRLKMRVGYTRRSWVKNCVSIGLSSGFIEPLESTGIFLVEVALRELVRNRPDGTFDDRIIDSFNLTMKYYYEKIRDFIVLHYCLTRRTDTPFWQANRHHAALPDTLQAKLEQLATLLPTAVDKSLFAGDFGSSLAFAYMNILAGMDWFSTHDVQSFAPGDEGEIAMVFDEIQRESTRWCETLPDHYRYLSQIHFHQRLHTALSSGTSQG